MNILILTPDVEHGETADYVYNLSLGLRRNNHVVWVACRKTGQQAAKLSNNGVSFVSSPQSNSSFSFSTLAAIIALAPIIINRRINIVHGTTKATYFLAFLLYKLFKIPYVNSFHEFPAGTTFKCPGIIAIAMTNTIKGYLIKEWKTPEKQIKVIYQAISAQETVVGPKKNRREFGLRSGSFIASLPVNSSGEEAECMTIEALGLIAQTDPNMFLIVPSKRGFQSKLAAIAQKLGFLNNVGFVSIKMPDLLGLIDILILPQKNLASAYDYLLASLYGIPVVAFNSGAAAEIITHKKNGFLFYSYDSFSLKKTMEEVIAAGQLRHTAAKNSASSLSFLAFSQMVEDTINVYKSVVSPDDEEEDTTCQENSL